MFKIIAAILAVRDIIKGILLLLAEAKEAARVERETRNVKAVEDAIQNKDQRGLEEAIGSTNAGKPARIRDGVRERARKDRR